LHPASQRLDEAQEAITVLEGRSMELNYQLVTRRERGIEDAMRLQEQESLHSVEVFVSL
jgi:hypothetical protein